MKIKHLIPALVLTFIANQAQSQLVVDNAITVDEAIAILLGPDVDFFNVTFNGDANQLGSFNSDNSNVGIATGIMLGTGDVTNGIGPNNSSSNSVGGGNSGASDPDLDDLDGLTHNDAAILEFDFVATGSTVSFDYVWASEEYPEYSGADGDGDGFSDCGNVSDVFGFFLSGPGINGAFSNNAENIALIPGSIDFVSIFNLNGGCDGTSAIGDVDCNYCEFYVYNGDGFTAPYNEPGSIYVQYDGLTVILTAVFDGLECGETYHIKLAVADVSDTAFDSAVFLKEGSFDVSGSLIDAFVLNPVPELGQNVILEGCIDANFIIHPPSCQTDPLDVTLFTTGTATSGVDYQGIPASITINGQSVTLPITTIADQNVEGQEDITVYFVYTNTEGVLDTASATLNLVDYLAPSVVVEDVYVCGNPETATADITNGFGPYSYDWSNGSTNPTAIFNEGSAGPYELVVTDYCGSEFSDAFNVVEPAPLELVTPIELCINDISDTLVFGGGLPYTFVYNTDTLTLYPGAKFSGSAPGTYEIFVTDQCGTTGMLVMDIIFCDTKIPNIFSPNGDGINEAFYIDGIEQFPNSKLMVWDRWGKLVYESSNYNNSWTAKDESDGVYYYVLQRSDGKNFEGYVHRVGAK
jgi:gliding motility-associated-like protein